MDLRSLIGTMEGPTLSSPTISIKLPCPAATMAGMRVSRRGKILLSSCAPPARGKQNSYFLRSKKSSETTSSYQEPLTCFDGYPCETDGNGSISDRAIEAAKLAVHHYNDEHYHEFKFVGVLLKAAEFNLEMELIILIKDGPVPHVYSVKVMYDDSPDGKCFTPGTWRTLDRLDYESIFSSLQSEGVEPKKSDNTKYYQLLGVSKSASRDDILKAYRFVDDPVKFDELSRAYDVLGHPEKRKIYDKYGEDALPEEKGGRHYQDTGNMFVGMYQCEGEVDCYISNWDIEVAKLAVQHYNDEHKKINLIIEEVKDGSVPHVHHVEVEYNRGENNFVLQAWRTLNRLEYKSIRL